MLRHQKYYLLSACGLIAVGAVCFFCLREQEPSYNGRTLSEWLAISSSDELRANREEARKAVLAIGTNAVPYLLEWCSERNLSRAEWSFNLYNKLPGFVRGMDKVSFWSRRDTMRYDHAVTGFQILGTNAIVALPELARRFNSSTNERFVNYTAFIIGHLGKPGLDFLMPVLNNRSDSRRAVVLQVIGGTMRYFLARDEAERAVPTMLNIMNDVSDPLGPEAAIELGRLGAAPERVVPQLANALRSTNVVLRLHAMQGLMEFRTNAIAVIPAIQIATNDSDANVRAWAAAALSAIAPDARTNAVLKGQ